MLVLHESAATYDVVHNEDKFMMKKFKFYKHSRCTDVVIMPIAIESDEGKQYCGGKSRKMVVEWYSIANSEGKPRKIGIREQIRIADEEESNWHEYIWK